MKARSALRTAQSIKYGITQIRITSQATTG